jgi:hypothetical protein
MPVGVRNYAAVARAVTNTASTTVPMWNLAGGTVSRLMLYDLISGSDATPADNYAEFAVRRTSAAGTTTATFTPTLLDSANGAAAGVFATTWSVNPTVTAASDLLNIPHNQRATFRWVANPGGELIVPVTAGAGLALMSVATNLAATYGWTAHWTE